MAQDNHSASSSSAATRFQVLDLEVDTGRQTVCRAGTELHVPKLSFDLLVALVRAAPNTVSVPELMERVWPHQVVGVETVGQRVKLLRRALGDDAAEPRYLAGERRRGYRIIAPTAVLSDHAAADAVREERLPDPPAVAPAAPAPTRPPPGRRIVVALGITFALVLIAALIDLVGRGPHPDAQSNISGVPARAPYSVAVLPFTAISAGSDDTPLARGIAELVTNRLTRESELTVIAADSALAARGESESSIQAGRRLGAHYVVDGTVQREGSAVRVSAQLIDVSEGRHIGALLVERPTSELFHLEDDIAGRLSHFLLGRVHPVQAAIPEFGADAMLAYLRGRALLGTRKAADAQAAVQEFSRAIAIAPAFASAYAARAEARFQQLFVSNTFDANAGELFEQTRPDLERALQLDPGNAPALFIRAKLRQTQGDLDGAAADYQRAMAIDPGFAPGVEFYAEFLNAFRSKPAEALAVLDAAIPVNPLAPRLLYLKALYISQWTHDTATAAELYLRTIQIAPEFYPAYNRLAVLRWSQGRLAEALGFGEAAVRIDPDGPWSRETLVRLYVDLGDLAAAREVVAQARAPSAHEGPTLLCYRAGQLEAALRYLRPALASRYTDTGGPPLAASITPLLEHVSRTRDYDAARAELLKMTWLTDEHGALDYSFDNALPLLQLATLEQLAGHQAAATQIATRVLGLPDDPSSQGNIAGSLERIRMLALAVLGRDEEALALLEAQRDRGARVLWWVWLERHPALERLRAQPRVRQLLAELHTWTQEQRVQVEAARRAGTLPVRPARAVPDPCASTVLAALSSQPGQP
jgi:TolB-like protein/DNA-binding winged helix-turn-helix (wHTH) protein/tetratricopeptide (TPR) repeat protein